MKLTPFFQLDSFFPFLFLDFSEIRLGSSGGIFLQSFPRDVAGDWPAE